MLYRAGVKWERDEDEGWKANVTDRIQVVTWKFGYPKPVHQCKLFIDYPLSKSKYDRQVGICLEARPTRDEAMKAGVEYAKKIIRDGVPGPEGFFRACYENWPTLFRNRLDVINHLFFVIGNGLAWLDGAIVDENPESRSDQLDDFAENEALVEDACKRLEKYQGTSEAEKPWYKSLADWVERERGGIGPLPDNGKLRSFYPVSEHSKVCIVPDDVRDDWLAVCYEAAVLLRDRSGGEREYIGKEGLEPQKAVNKRIAVQKKYGNRLIQEFRTRFPGRVPMEG